MNDTKGFSQWQRFFCFIPKRFWQELSGGEAQLMFPFIQVGRFSKTVTNLTRPFECEIHLKDLGNVASCYKIKKGTNIDMKSLLNKKSVAI